MHDPADITGEGYPVKGMEVIEHAENHNVPTLTNQILEKVRKLVVSAK
jgi:hypothetical protein